MSRLSASRGLVSSACYTPGAQRPRRTFMRRLIALAAAALLILCTDGLLAQQAPPTFRSRTELIIVDAVVVDKDGTTVRGLKATDFALTDRKKPQRIETFEEVSHVRPDRMNPAGAALPMLPLTLK